MSLFSRFFKVVESEANSALDNIEDPIKMTEQGIRDLKKDLREAMEALAQVKATAIRLGKDLDNQKKAAANYERKAMLVLQKAQSGAMEASEADSLAMQALSKKEEHAGRAQSLVADHQAQQNMSNQLQTKVNKLKQTITRYENELVTLRARAKTADSMRKINEQMARVDDDSTINMLEKMRNKVMEQESLAQAYGEMADADTSIDAQLDKALIDDSAGSAQAQDSLAALKAKMAAAS